MRQPGEREPGPARARGLAQCWRKDARSQGPFPGGRGLVLQENVSSHPRLRGCAEEQGSLSKTFDKIRPQRHKICGFSFLFVFLLFLGPLPRHMEIPRLGVQSEL